MKVKSTKKKAQRAAKSDAQPKPRARFLPPDPEQLNDNRAGRAAEALAAFRDSTGCNAEDSLCDLLCNLRHWADRYSQDWHAQLRRAMRHYEEETDPTETPTQL